MGTPLTTSSVVVAVGTHLLLRVYRLCAALLVRYPRTGTRIGLGQNWRLGKLGLEGMKS